MISVIVRIALRWIAGALLAHGWASTNTTDLFVDPDVISMVQMGAGVVCGAAAEAWYYLARRWKLST